MKAAALAKYRLVSRELAVLWGSTPVSTACLPTVPHNPLPSLPQQVRVVEFNASTPFKTQLETMASTSVLVRAGSVTPPAAGLHAAVTHL